MYRCSTADVEQFGLKVYPSYSKGLAFRCHAKKPFHNILHHTPAILSCTKSEGHMFTYLRSVYNSIHDHKKEMMHVCVVREKLSAWVVWGSFDIFLDMVPISCGHLECFKTTLKIFSLLASINLIGLNKYHLYMKPKTEVILKLYIFYSLNLCKKNNVLVF